MNSHSTKFVKFYVDQLYAVFCIQSPHRHGDTVLCRKYHDASSFDKGYGFRFCPEILLYIFKKQSETGWSHCKTPLESS